MCGCELYQYSGLMICATMRMSDLWSLLRYATLLKVLGPSGSYSRMPFWPVLLTKYVFVVSNADYENCLLCSWP